MTTPIDSAITCWNCEQVVTHDGTEWIGRTGCIEPGGHAVGCTQDMGLNTDCGDDAEHTRDGFPLCGKHAARWDTLRYLESVLDTFPADWDVE